MNIICPICKENINSHKMRNEVSSIYSDILYELVSCDLCGHLFISNPPSVNELNAIYESTYNYEAHLAIENEKKWRAKQIFRKLADIVPINAMIIDIGCMYGFTLEVLRSLGYRNLIGIEINASAVMECKKKGFTAFQGTFSQWVNSNASKFNEGCTCFLLSHVIEHIQNIHSFLNELHDILKVGDYLIIMVPNSNARTTVLLKQNWGWWQVPVHVHHYTKESLLYLLSAYGYKIEKPFRRGGDSLFWLSSLASLLGIKSKSQNISFLQKLVIKGVSIILRYWFFIGDEELIVVARKK